MRQVAEKGLALGFTSSHEGEGVSFVIGHLASLLKEHGYTVRTAGPGPAAPGEIVLIDASSIFSNQDAFALLRDSDLILLIVKAEETTVPMLENVLATLHTAFKKVDGIIINRRRYKVPKRVMDYLKRFQNRG